MDEYTAEEAHEALAPTASLLNKSEKARQRVAPGTWQHAMLEDNINALRSALELIGDPSSGPGDVATGSLEEALRALDSMIARIEDTQMKSSPGTSQHSLQRTRLKALRIARSAVMARLVARQ